MRAPPASRCRARAGAHLLREMLRIRRFEETCAELYTQEKIRGFLHLYIGEEAVAVGVMQALRPRTPSSPPTASTATRSRAASASRAVMAEMFGKQDGLQPRAWRFDAPVRRRDALLSAATRSSAAACRSPSALALADQTAQAARRHRCFFGDGAVAEGEFHESLNLAALWELPVLFVLREQPVRDGHRAGALGRSETDLCRKAVGYGVPAAAVDGMDVRRGGGGARAAPPTPCARAAARTSWSSRTYRFRAHSMYDPQLYRDKDEVEAWKQRDPIATFTARLDGGHARDRRARCDRSEVAARSTTRSRSPSRHAGAGRGAHPVRHLPTGAR